MSVYLIAKEGGKGLGGGDAVPSIEGGPFLTLKRSVHVSTATS
jgi:hypothetical protein